MTLPDAVVTLESIAQDIGARPGKFTGVVTVDGPEGRVLERAVGLAHRALNVPITTASRFGIASGSKTFTAVILLRLARRGLVDLDAPVRTWLGDDLPLIAPTVTLAHLLTHTSGIGDYLDEDLLEGDDDYILSEPVHRLTTAEAFLPMLEGFPQREEPGTAFRYNNGGFVVASIIAERVTGRTYAELVEEEVAVPAGLSKTGILRLDSLPGDVAMGYLDETGDRCNLFHLSVLAAGDGGAFTTADDVLTFWRALASGKLLDLEDVELMARPRNDVPSEGKRYGLGMWLHPTGRAWIMEGCDAGQSFRSTYDPVTGLTATVLSNTAFGAWNIVKAVGELF